MFGWVFGFIFSNGVIVCLKVPAKREKKQMTLIQMNRRRHTAGCWEGVVVQGE